MSNGWLSVFHAGDIFGYFDVRGAGFSDCASLKALRKASE